MTARHPPGGTPLKTLVARGVAVAAVVFGLLLALTSYALVDLSHQQHRLGRVLEPSLSAAAGYYEALLSAETGLRGYVLAGSESFLEPYAEAQPVIATERGRLARLLADEPALGPAERSFDQAAAAWQQQYAASTVAALRSGAPLSSVDPSGGKALFDRIRSTHDELQKQLNIELAHNERAVDLARWLVLVAQVVVLVVVAAAAALVVVGLRRRVLRPLEQLGEDARGVGGGQLTRRIEPVGPAEVQQLATVLEGMRVQLVNRLHELAGREEQLAAQAQELLAQADELTERGTALERSNRDLEQFAYVASHDLQEPLRKVTSFCQLLQQRYGGQLDERADTYIGFATDGASRMQVLINDLLTFSRVGRSRTVTEVDLDQVAARVLADLGPRAEDAGATVTVGPLPTIWADATMMGQLLQNLVGNGMKFRDPDRPPVVRVSGVVDSDGLRLDVADNGIGIEPQFAEKVFVIFQRLHAREAYSGTGIGLALCKRIVEAEEGEIWFDSEPGVGTTFHVRLPASVLTPPDVEREELEAAAPPDVAAGAAVLPLDRTL